MKVAFLAVAVLAIAGAAIYFGSSFHAVKASRLVSAARSSAASALHSQSLTLPLFFEPNQGQTAPQVKFLARGSGYRLFLTSDEAVLTLRRSTPSSQVSVVNSQKTTNSVIRMRLDGANLSAQVSGASPLAGKSNYFIGNDRSKWRSDIPQFAQVEYQSVYPGVDLVYYGNQEQLEYDFRVAPGADPNQIALSFKGAAARLDAGDLVLSTDNGDVRFHAPRIYQPSAGSAAKKVIAGNFRQLADNKIGFTIGDYDRSRQLVIDPTLTYSTYLGGSGTEGLVKLAVDSAGLIYVAGSTNSSDFPTDIALVNNPNNPPFQAQLKTPGATNIFIAVLNPTLIPPQFSCTPNPPDPPYACTSQLVYATYLGGSGVDSLAGIAVDLSFDIYVAGYTSSPDFPTTGNAFQAAPAVAGTHGFLSKLSNVSPNKILAYGLSYSTYLAGNKTDHVTGLAIDAGCDLQACNAYVTGDTTSSNQASDFFPANPNGFQTTSNSPGNPQFFASKINTTGSGQLSMIYSTYFGGSNPANATAVGGGIAVDEAASNANVYITGTTNMLPQGLNGGLGFPLFAAQQSCLNLASQTSCSGSNGGTNTDAFVAKITPKPGVQPVYSTYLGGGGIDAGLAIAVDSSSNAYITGSTSSSDWVNCGGFQCTLNGPVNAFVAKIGPLTGSVYPITYFSYVGGTGQDSGQDIKVDSLQAAHVVGNTTSPALQVLNPLGPSAISNYNGGVYGGEGDAFVAVLGTTLAGRGEGDYLTYLGGNQLDQGTGIAFDTFGATYVAGTTVSPNFPTVNPFQSGLNSGSQDAFVSKLGSSSTLLVTQPTSSPSPSPVNAGTPVAFTFDIINTGPDDATFVTFFATVPTGANFISQQAKVTSGAGNCSALQGNTIVCDIQNLAVCTGTCTTGAAVEVDVTPAITGNALSVTVSGEASANGGPVQATNSQFVDVVDFKMNAQTSTPTINAGDTALVQINFCPTNLTSGYSGTITPSQTTAPSMVTATTPTFNPTTVALAGTSCQSTTLSIPTVARPVTTGSLLRGGASFATFSATWLPIGGLTLVGLGFGAGRKLRRSLAGGVLCVIAGVVALQAGCGSSSSAAVTTGGTVAGTYTITVNGSAGTGSSHSTQVNIRVN